YPLLQRFVQYDRRLETDEQNHAHIAPPVLPDRERFDDFVETFDRGINFGSADTYSAWIQHGIGASVDHDAVVFCQSRVVTVVPHTREPLKVGCPVPGSVGIIPESNRHGGEGCGAHQLSAITAHGFSEVVENIDAHSE